jgi:hypothetical protein
LPRTVTEAGSRERHALPARLNIVILGVSDVADSHPWEVTHNPFFEIGSDGTITIP